MSYFDVPHVSVALEVRGHVTAVSFLGGVLREGPSFSRPNR